VLVANLLPWFRLSAVNQKYLPCAQKLTTDSQHSLHVEPKVTEKYNLTENRNFVCDRLTLTRFRRSENRAVACVYRLLGSLLLLLLLLLIGLRLLLQCWIAGYT